MKGAVRISAAMALGISLALATAVHAGHIRHDEAQVPAHHGDGAGQEGHDSHHGDAKDIHHGSIAGAFGDEHENWADPFPPESLVQSAVVPSSGCPALLNHRVNDLRGRLIDLCAFAGKVLLVVNTASRCGFTPQYEGLQALHDTYRERGLVVMGFPSNDFGRQEPGSSKDIAEFCEKNFGVRFPLFAKVKVRGADKVPLYRMLTTRPGPGIPTGEIGWNFEKFLIGRDGEVIARFKTRIKPRSQELVRQLDLALGDT